ncbi:imidazole glycerol phosphate synthase subunit HisH [Alicyclobacillus sacchari]|uniref:imidazole glycerol phosphate synthase subunit HisH n=1 Tax=Alicyclobacillus sacchari TaxID=392010 RepID=UPI0023E928AF|nr:imidazole glycerol phosphate synthase subunit HisH [Alicyclobacillus sacchari]
MWKRGLAVQGVILPGVGAFGDAMAQLRASGLVSVVEQVVALRIPLLGICVGMQLLFTVSSEHGEHRGLDLLPGRVVRFPETAKVPHMGWNDLTSVRSADPLMQDVAVGDFVYFVHSYYVQVDEAKDVIAAASYGGVQVPAVVGRELIYGTQFHPEKSGEVGETILRNFVRMTEAKKTGVSS